MNVSEGRRILVIDDSMTVRKLVEIAFRGTAHTLDFAATGTEGLIRARDGRPDVILLDYMLPDLKGTEICRRLGQEVGTAEVPILMMSANSHKLMGEFREFPMVVDFVGKPFTAQGIRAQLHRAGTRLAAGSISSTDLPLGRDGVAALARPTPTELALRGNVATTSVRDVLRLLGASKATGSLVVHDTTPAVAWLRRGDIVLCTAAADSIDAVPADVAAPVRAMALRDQQVGKPVAITLAEAGVRSVSTLPLELQAASKRAIGELFRLRQGAFEWHAAATLPDYVEAFGRPMSLAAIELACARDTIVDEDVTAVLAHSYDRTRKFSDKLAGAKLDVDERKILAAVDGRPGHELVARLRLAPVQVANILERLRAADLVARDAQVSLGVRKLGVCIESDPGLVADLRAAFRRHAGSLEVVEIASGPALIGSIAHARPDLVLIESSILTGEARLREVSALQREGDVQVVALLPRPMGPQDAWLVDAGLHGVLCQPVHVSELLRLVFL